MQTTCCVNQDHICTISLGTGKGVESHRGRVRAHLLLDNRYTHALAPNTELLYGSSTEGVCSAQIYFLTSLLELPGQFTDGSGLSHAIYTYNENDIGLVVTGQIPVIIVFGIVFCQQFCDLIAQNTIELRGADILIARYTRLDAFDDFQSGIYTYITGDEHLFKIIKHIVIDLRFTSYRTREFIKHAGLGFLKALIECFLLVLTKKSKYSHIAFYYACKINKFR